MKIFDNTGKETSQAAVLKTYFGMHPGETLQEFMNECKALTPEAKEELSRGAAKELGYTVKD